MPDVPAQRDFTYLLLKVLKELAPGDASEARREIYANPTARHVQNVLRVLKDLQFMITGLVPLMTYVLDVSLILILDQSEIGVPRH